MLLNDFKVKAEREQFQAQMQMEAEKSTAKAEQLRLSANLDNEVANNRRMETEVCFLCTFSLTRITLTRAMKYCYNC